MITSEEYRREVESLAETIKEEVREHGGDVFDVLHETVDNHRWVIYTAHHYYVLALSENDGYAISVIGVNPVDGDTLNTAALAFGALYADVAEALDGWTGPDDDEDEDEEGE